MNFLALLIALVSVNAFAQTPEDVTPTPTPSAPKTTFDFNGMGSARYNSVPSSKVNALQESVVFGFTVSPAGIFDLVGLIQTGSTYGSRHTTVLDFNNPSKDQFAQTLYFKNLYLQKAFRAFGNNTTAQFGVLGTDQKIGNKFFSGSSTGIGTNAWVEGARMKMDTHIGTLSVTGESLNDITQPDILTRTRKLNYLEVQVSEKILDQLSVELSGGSDDKQTFLRGATEENVKLLGTHVLRLVQEGFYNMSTQSASYSASAAVDLGEFFKHDLAGRLNLDLRYSYNNPNVGTRGRSGNNPVLKGNIFTVALYGKVNKSGTLNWFSAYDFGDQTHFQSGMNWKFQKKKVVQPAIFETMY